jgi:hypothetical protein
MHSIEGTGRISEDTSREYDTIQHDPISADTIVPDRLDPHRHFYSHAGIHPNVMFGAASSMIVTINNGLGLDLRLALKLQYSGF